MPASSRSHTAAYAQIGVPTSTQRRAVITIDFRVGIIIVLPERSPTRGA
jgi:hypothetical protein